MNRREVLAGIMTVAAAPAMGELNITDRLRAQYAICKERGHRPTQWGNTNPMVVNFNGSYRIVPDGPPKPYPGVGVGEWQTCWDCKTLYRFVTTMEEKDTP